MKDRCFVCKPITDEELEEWKEHSGFNAYRYGIHKYERVKHKKPQADDVLAYLEWERSWSANGVPG